ncbi:hypothetical protein ACFVTE_02110 [Arthrobacter sp. NPDC058097]|uniref:hypothetical protein n=1 Tax=Arthrobacter sp. NPDC058097 TaxID=3346340 RepID=UPI0036DF7313
MSTVQHGQRRSATDNRRVAFATIIGTTIDWYDQAEQEVGATVFDRRRADSADAAKAPAGV